MFDVSWIDPERETVGQRKSRKDSALPHPKTSIGSGSRRSSMFSSKSVEEQKTKPSLLNLLDKSDSLNRRENKPLERAISSSRSEARQDEKSNEVSRWASDLYDAPQNVSNEPISPALIGPTDCILNNRSSGPCHSDTGQSSNSDVSDSVFSGWTGISAKTESSGNSASDPASSPARTDQPLSPTSCMSRSTEVSIAAHESIDDLEAITSAGRISVAAIQAVEKFEESDGLNTTSPRISDFRVPKFQVSQKVRTIAFHNNEINQTRWPSRSHGKVADRRKSSDLWECQLDERLKPLKRVEAARTGEHAQKKKSSRNQTIGMTKVTYFQRNIRRMEAASAKVVLQRLKEEWNEIADASVYRELELEKQLWMLTALRTLRRKTSQQQIVNNYSGVQKVLSLYENHASASLTSALNIATEVHHLSMMPLSPKSYPNVHPLAIPGPTLPLPYASNNFTSISAFSLLSLLPASSIPALLKECHRTLVSPSITPTSTTISETQSAIDPPYPFQGGILHLILLDPSPIEATLGPHMRRWLDTHLIFNLEKHFRCINPSRLFPIWLAEAGLQARGSTINRVRFFASIEPSQVKAMADGEFGTTEHELKTVVGRMLWKEIWGGFVQGERWWWEDLEIMEECENLGTCWEYSEVVGMKEV